MKICANKIKEWIGIFATVATIICAYPVIKEWTSSSPEVIVRIGNYPLKNTEEVSLYFVFEKSLLQKYEIPLPFSIYNEGKAGVTNVSIYISTKMKAVPNTDGGYMKRIVGGNEAYQDSKQYVQLSKIDLPSKGYLSLDDYSFNVVNEISELRDNQIWDSFHCNFILSHDYIKQVKQFRIHIYCLFLENSAEFEQRLQQTNHEGATFLIYANNDCDKKSADGIPVQICKLGKVYKIKEH